MCRMYKEEDGRMIDVSTQRKIDEKTADLIVQLGRAGFSFKEIGDKI